MLQKSNAIVCQAGEAGACLFRVAGRPSAVSNPRVTALSASSGARPASGSPTLSVNLRVGPQSRETPLSIGPTAMFVAADRSRIDPRPPRVARFRPPAPAGSSRRRSADTDPECPPSPAPRLPKTWLRPIKQLLRSFQMKTSLTLCVLIPALALIARAQDDTHPSTGPALGGEPTMLIPLEEPGTGLAPAPLMVPHALPHYYGRGEWPGFGSGHGHDCGTGCIGATWGCCPRPCSAHLHLWDNYCYESARCPECGFSMGGMVHSLWCARSAGCNGSRCDHGGCGDDGRPADGPVNDVADPSDQPAVASPPEPADESAVKKPTAPGRRTREVCRRPRPRRWTRCRSSQ